MSSVRWRTDRREHERFDVTGRLWGALEEDAPAVLRNIALNGAMVEAAVAPAMRTMRIARISLRGPDLELVAAVRYMRSVSDDDDRCLIGVEFINLSDADLAALDVFVSACRDGQSR